MLNRSVHAASTAVITTGRYSGLHPASTALMATFSTVHSTRSGGTTATTSSGARVVPVSMRATRSGVGGTTGRPSPQPRSKPAPTSSPGAPRATGRGRVWGGPGGERRATWEVVRVGAHPSPGGGDPPPAGDTQQRRDRLEVERERDV